MTTARCEQLEAENEMLREALGLKDVPVALRLRLGLTATESKILGMLMRFGKVSHERFNLALYDERAARMEDPQNCIRVLVSKVRRKIARHGAAIRRIYGWGYELDDVSRKRLAAMQIAHDVSRELERASA